MSSFRWIQGKDYERKQQAPGLMLIESMGRVRTPRSDLTVKTNTHLIPECNKSWEPLEKWIPNSEDPCVNFIVDRFEQMSSSEYTNNRPMYGAIHVQLREPVSLLGLSTGTGDRKVAVPLQSLSPAPASP